MNSIPNSRFLSAMTDEQIREGCAKIAQSTIDRVFPGTSVTGLSLTEALAQTRANFTVEKHPLLVVNDPEGLKNPDAPIQGISSHMATVRTDSNQTLGIVGKDYGVVQTSDALQALEVLAAQGGVEIRNVEVIGGGSRVRVTALLGTTEFLSATQQPNTLAHFAVFEATHDGSACTTVVVFTLRVECLNGMTSKSIVKTHKLYHTAKVGERLDAYAVNILSSLLGDVEAEKAFFLAMVDKRMTTAEFSVFTDEFLGGEPKEDDSKSKKTRFENQKAELLEYFEGGNQGAGPTLWGAWNSVTRFITAKREGIADAKRAAKKFESAVNGDGQKKLQKAERLLRARW